MNAVVDTQTCLVRYIILRAFQEFSSYEVSLRDSRDAYNMHSCTIYFRRESVACFRRLQNKIALLKNVSVYHKIKNFKCDII